MARAGARWRTRGRGTSGQQRLGTVEAGAGQAAREHGRRGWYEKEAVARGPRWL
jgi:hypothetical protein